ncbi:MAG: hypothetical protein Q9191_005053 [Dirinaria sp. TL-2023a]
MIPSLCMSICALAGVCAAATLPHPSLRINSTTTSASNLLTLSQSPEVWYDNLSVTAKDPRFRVLFRDTGEDLSDKSTYLNVLRALWDLSKLPFISSFSAARWSIPEYEDVMITVDPDRSFPRLLQVDHVMWALEATVQQIWQSNFHSHQVQLAYDYGGEVGELVIGFMQISRPTRPVISTGTNSTSEPGPNATFAIGIPATTTNGTITSLDARGWALKQHLTGPRVPKNVIFTLIFGAIIRMAEFPRSEFPRHDIQFIRTPGWALGIKSSESQNFEYEQVQWMLYHIAKGMYGDNKFRLGSVIMTVNEQTVGYAEFRRRPSTSVT